MKFKLRTVIMLSVFLLSVIVGSTWLFIQNGKKVPSQVQLINSLLNTEMVSTDNNNLDWETEVNGIYYHCYNTKGEETGYCRVILTADMDKAEDLTNFHKVANYYFPDKSDEIYQNVLHKYSEFKDYRIDMIDYEYSESESKKVIVRAFNVEDKFYVAMDMAIPV